MSATSNLKTDILNLLLKSEVTYGTDPTPVVGTDAFQVKDFTWEAEFTEIPKPRMGARPRSTGWQIGNTFIKLKCVMDWGGSLEPGMGDPFIEPPWMTWAKKVCGAKVNATGTPVDTHACVYDFRVAVGSATIYCDYYDEGSDECRRAKFHGCRFKMSHMVKNNEAYEITFEGEGIFGGDEDVSNVVEPTFLDVDVIDDAANGKAMSVTVGGVSTDVSEIKLTMNRSLSHIPSVQATYGIKKILIDVKPGDNITLEMDRELKMKADNDFFGDLYEEGKVAWSYQIDSANGNRLVVSGDRVQSGSFKYEKKDGHWRVPQKFAVCDASSAGDDAITFTQTRTP